MDDLWAESLEKSTGIGKHEKAGETETDAIQNNSADLEEVCIKKKRSVVVRCDFVFKLLQPPAKRNLTMNNNFDE